MNIFIKDLKNLKTDFVCQLYTLLLSSKPFGILFFRRNVIVPQGEIIMITFYEGYESISAMKTMADTFTLKNLYLRIINLLTAKSNFWSLTSFLQEDEEWSLSRYHDIEKIEFFLKELRQNF